MSALIDGKGKRASRPLPRRPDHVTLRAPALGQPPAIGQILCRGCVARDGGDQRGQQNQFRFALHANLLAARAS
jgi:hypothetical protein